MILLDSSVFSAVCVSNLWLHTAVEVFPTVFCRAKKKPAQSSSQSIPGEACDASSTGIAGDTACWYNLVVYAGMFYISLYSDQTWSSKHTNFDTNKRQQQTQRAKLQAQWPCHVFFVFNTGLQPHLPLPSRPPFRPLVCCTLARTCFSDKISQVESA